MTNPTPEAIEALVKAAAQLCDDEAKKCDDNAVRGWLQNYANDFNATATALRSVASKIRAMPVPSDPVAVGAERAIFISALKVSMCFMEVAEDARKSGNSSVGIVLAFMADEYLELAKRLCDGAAAQAQKG